MNEQRQDDQLEPTYSSSVPIWDVSLKTCRKQWTIEKGGAKESGIAVLMAQHDDDDDDFNSTSTRLELFSAKWFIVQTFVLLFLNNTSCPRK